MPFQNLFYIIWQLCPHCISLLLYFLENIYLVSFPSQIQLADFLSCDV